MACGWVEGDGVAKNHAVGQELPLPPPPPRRTPVELWMTKNGYGIWHTYIRRRKPNSHLATPRKKKEEERNGRTEGRIEPLRCKAAVSA